MIHHTDLIKATWGEYEESNENKARITALNLPKTVYMPVLLYLITHSYFQNRIYVKTIFIVFMQVRYIDEIEVHR
jgi:hypothetical protein